MLNVTVEMSKWLRGTQPSYLLDVESGRMCCLGFVCLAVGLAERSIRNKRSIACVSQSAALPPALEKLYSSDNRCDSDVAEQLMMINDELEVPDTERCAKLVRVSKEAEIAFTFVP